MPAAPTEAGPRERAAARVGSTIRSKWKLDAVLGVGGMASVFAATHENGARAALKVMHTEFARDENIRARFLREGEIARAVDDPGCVKIVADDVTEHGEPFLIMELLVGHTLEQLWRKLGRQLAVKKALNITVDMLKALEAFHSKSIVHRDLKPANIFITKRGKVKLLDFGVAQVREPGRDMTRIGLAMGTPAYMAPEQAMGRSDEVDHRADIYAVGATLYTVLSGERLHHGASDQEAYVLAATQPAPSVARVAPDLPLDVVTVVDKALQWDRRNRYQSAAEMRRAIEGLGQPASSSAPAGSDGAPDSAQFDGRFELDLDSEPPAAAPISVGAPAIADGAFDIELDDAPSVTPSPLSRAALSEAQPSTRRLAKATQEVPLDPSHPLAPLFVSIDRMLRTARQYGPAHPETQNRLSPVFAALNEALEANPQGVHFRVLPFCFSHDEAVVWEPAPPGDIVPYTLSVAGLREVTISSGVTEGELRELFGAMMIDANSDPGEIATALWEAPFQHISCRLEEDLGGEDATALEQFFAETSELEKQLRTSLSDMQRLVLSMKRTDVLEAAAMAAMTDPLSETAALLEPPQKTQQRLAKQLLVSDEELSARHDEVLLAAFADGVHRSDSNALYEALSSYSQRLVRLGRHDKLFEAHRSLIASFDGDGPAAAPDLDSALLTRAMFPAEIIVHLVRRASGWDALLSAEQSEAALAGLRLVAGTMSDAALPLFLRLADRTREGPVFAIVLDYLARVAENNEQAVIAELESMDPLTTQQILTRLLEQGGDRVKAMLEPLKSSSNTALRCEAVAQLAESQIALTQELMSLFGSDDKSVRWAALDTFVRHQVRSAGPALVRLVEHDDFKTRSLDEQQKIFDALFALNAHRTETLLSALVQKHGLIADEALEQTRSLAARMLGEWAASAAALDAVKAATSRMWWNSAPLREVAALAATSIEERMSRAADEGSDAGRQPLQRWPLRPRRTPWPSKTPPRRS